jgi:hypothetical protein
MKFRTKSQLDHIEKGGILDDCGPSSVAALVSWAAGYDELDISAGDAIKKKALVTGQVDRNGVSDNGSSLAQLIKVANAFGARARYAKSWEDVVDSAKRGAGIGVWVQQGPTFYPAGQEVSAWHVKWAKYWSKKDPAHYRAGYGHMTAAGYDVEEGTWYWCCPTRSGKGAEAYGVKITEENLRKIADSKRAAGKDKLPDFRHTIIVEYARKKTTPVSTPAPVLAPDEAIDPRVLELPSPKPVAAPKAVDPVITPKPIIDPSPSRKTPNAGKSAYEAELAALGRVDWDAVGDEAGKLLARGLEETKGKKMIDRIKWIIANTGIDEALLEAARVGLSTGIAVMLATGAPILDMTAQDFRTVGSGAIAATLQVLIRALNKDDSSFGVGRAKAVRAAEKTASGVAR